jgi:hypothetical protein
LKKEGDVELVSTESTESTCVSTEEVTHAAKFELYKNKIKFLPTLKVHF